MNKQPIGANGILYIMADAKRRFEGKLSGGSSVELPPSQNSDAVSDTRVILSHCPKCKGNGFYYHCASPGGAQALRCDCDVCDGTGKIEHTFPREIVELTAKLFNADQLTIARTLAGLSLGMTP